MSKSFRIQENVYNTFLKLKNRKKQQQFLEKCFIYAWENREIETDYDVDLAFCGVKPSIKLSNNGGGLNNPTGINGTKPLKNKENDMSDYGQSEVSVMSDGGQSFISNKDISNKNEDTSNKSKDNTTEAQSSSFGYAWSIYPKRRRESKKDVYPVWCKVVKENNISEEELVRAVERYSTSEDATKDDGQYAKGFKAWLRGGCYAYEYKQIEQQPKLEEKPFNPAEHDFDMFGEKLWGDKKCTITE